MQSVRPAGRFSAKRVKRGIYVGAGDSGVAVSGRQSGPSLRNGERRRGFILDVGLCASTPTPTLPLSGGGGAGTARVRVFAKAVCM